MKGITVLFVIVALVASVDASFIQIMSKERAFVCPSQGVIAALVFEDQTSCLASFSCAITAEANAHAVCCSDGILSVYSQTPSFGDFGFDYTSCPPGTLPVNASGNVRQLFETNIGIRSETFDTTGSGSFSCDDSQVTYTRTTTGTNVYVFNQDMFPSGEFCVGCPAENSIPAPRFDEELLVNPSFASGSFDASWEGSCNISSEASDGDSASAECEAAAAQASQCVDVSEFSTFIEANTVDVMGGAFFQNVTGVVGPAVTFAFFTDTACASLLSMESVFGVDVGRNFTEISGTFPVPPTTFSILFMLTVEGDNAVVRFDDATLKLMSY